MSRLIIDYDLSVQPAMDRDTRIRDAAPEMYELLEYIRDTATIETATDVLERVNTLLARIEGGGE